ncbi:mechanosensitive ion channel [Candidatus Woesearchaeota archaeon]|nr:mechanosensitive ion channel [Candidatus Woesearchaeota archaeon]
MEFQEMIIIFNNFLKINPYIEAGFYLIVFFILSKIVLYLFEKVFLQLAKKTATNVDDEIVLALRTPLSIIIFIIGVKLFFIALLSSFWWEKYLGYALDSVMIFYAISAALKVVDIIIEGWAKKWAQKSESTLDDQIIRLAHQFLIVIGWIVGFLMILSVWEIEVGPMLAGLGIGGLAIAFALQPTLANIFGGISLILDKTIKVGDIVKLESGESGVIHDIGIRSTRIKTWTREILVVPNSKLVDSKVFNFNQPDRMVRVDIDFGVAYGSNIEKVKKLALDCAKGEKHIMKDPKPFVLFTSMGDSALLFSLKIYIDDLDNKWDTHQSVITKLYDKLNKAKISIPFPQRELWVHNLKK